MKFSIETKNKKDEQILTKLKEPELLAIIAVVAALIGAVPIILYLSRPDIDHWPLVGIIVLVVFCLCLELLSVYQRRVLLEQHQRTLQTIEKLIRNNRSGEKAK